MSETKGIAEELFASLGSNPVEDAKKAVRSSVENLKQIQEDGGDTTVALAEVTANASILDAEALKDSSTKAAESEENGAGTEQDI